MKSIVFKDLYNYCYLYSFSKRKLLQISLDVFDLLDYYLNKGEHWLGGSVASQTCSFFEEYGFLDFIDTRVDAGISVEDLEQAVSMIPVITFELTQQCNLKCKYCVYGEMYETEEGSVGNELSFEVAKAVIDFSIQNDKSNNRLQGFRRTIVIGFYGGEPLLKIDLIKQIISYTKLQETDYLSFSYNMTTNAVLLDKYMDYIVEQNISLLLSLDGDKKASSYRLLKNGNDSFDKVYSNIKELKNKYTEYYMGKVSFNAVLHNQSTLTSLLHFYHQELNKVPMISTLATSFVKKSASNDFNCMFRGIDAELIYNQPDIPLRDFLKLDPSLIMLNRFYEVYSGYFYKTFRELVNDYSYVDYIPGGTCIPFSSKLFVSADGKMHPCERIGYNYPLGYVSESNEVVVNLDEIVEKYNSYYDRLRSKCLSCYRVQFCPKCFLQHNIECKPISRKEMTDYLVYIINICHKNRNYLNKFA